MEWRIISELSSLPSSRCINYVTAVLSVEWVLKLAATVEPAKRTPAATLLILVERAFAFAGGTHTV